MEARNGCRRQRMGPEVQEDRLGIVMNAMLARLAQKSAIACVIEEGRAFQLGYLARRLLIRVKIGNDL